MDRLSPSDGVRSYLSNAITRGVGTVRRAKRHISPQTQSPITSPPSSSRGSSGRQTPALASIPTITLNPSHELKYLSAPRNSDKFNTTIVVTADAEDDDDDDDDLKPILAIPPPEAAQRSTRSADLPPAQLMRERSRRARRKRQELDFASFAYQDGMRFSSFD